MKIKVKSVVNYAGHGLSANGSVNLTLKASYSELPNSVQLLQMLNNDVHIKAKMPDTGYKYDIGIFRIKSINFDGDGESTIKFNSTDDFVETNNLNELVTKELFTVLFWANVEVEGGEESE